LDIQGNETMATHGTAYFDGKGQFFKTPEDATISDLAAMLGRVGEGDSLAPGIAKTLYQRRIEIERIFTDHDDMMRAKPRKPVDHGEGPRLVADGGSKVAAFRPAG
jgi:hypothetical protein